MVSHLRISWLSLFVCTTLMWGALQALTQVGVATRASAQGASDKAAAESLFDRGLSLLKEGKYAEACERLEQSQSIERGIGTMLYLAECYEKVGKSASAWALFREAASQAQAEGQVERAEAGKRRAEKLEKTLSRMAVQVPAANKVDGLRITDNGSALQTTVWGLSLPVDPGVHRIEAQARGYLPWTSEVKVGANADSVEVRVPALEKDPNAVAVSETPAPTPAATASAGLDTSRSTPGSAAAAEPEATRMSNQRIVGVALGAAGLVSILVGAITGGLAIKNDKASKDHTDQGKCSDEKCETLSDKAVKQATASTVGWALGGGLVAAGLITFLLGPKHQPRADVAVRIDHQTAALRVGGVF
jgi:serine/threonine-protein kinase